MKIQRRVKQVLAIAGVLLAGLSSVGAAALKENTADIQQLITIPPMNIVISNVAPGGCPAGQLWDVVVGKCAPPQYLRSVGVSQACGCSCPELGSCTAQQNGSYNVMGWRLPPSASELVSYNTGVSWGACTQTSNSCYAAPPPPTGTAPAFTSSTSSMMELSEGGAGLGAQPHLVWSAAGILPTTTYLITPNCKYGIDNGGKIFSPTPGVTSWWFGNAQKLQPNPSPQSYTCSADFDVTLTACNGADCSSTIIPIKVSVSVTGG